MGSADGDGAAHSACCQTRRSAVTPALRANKMSKATAAQLDQLLLIIRRRIILICLLLIICHPRHHTLIVLPQAVCVPQVAQPQRASALCRRGQSQGSCY